MIVELNGKELSNYWEFLEKNGNEEKASEIEHKILDSSFDEYDKISYEFFKNIVFAYAYTYMSTFEDEDWYDEYDFDEINNFDRKLTDFPKQLTRNEQDWKYETEFFVKENIRKWLNNHLGLNHEYKLK